MFEWLRQLIAAEVFRVVLPLLLIAVLAFVGARLVDFLADLAQKRLVTPIREPDRRARLHTLIKVARYTARVLILGTAGLVAMGTIGIDIGPALAAAGILGLTISLGAQSLIKDVISGLIILLEDEYRVGDVIKVGAVGGEVEQFNLRCTSVRDGDGRLWIVPNGEVRILANETREWARAVVELNFAFNSEVDKVVAALEGAMASLADDPRVKPSLLSTPEVFGWSDVTDWSVVVRLRAKVAPGKQGEVARAMRQRALDTLRGLEIPVESQNQRVLVAVAGS